MHIKKSIIILIILFIVGYSAVASSDKGTQAVSLNPAANGYLTYNEFSVGNLFNFYNINDSQVNLGYAYNLFTDVLNIAGNINYTYNNNYGINFGLSRALFPSILNYSPSIGFSLTCFNSNLSYLHFTLGLQLFLKPYKLFLGYSLMSNDNIIGLHKYFILKKLKSQIDMFIDYAINNSNIYFSTDIYLLRKLLEFEYNFAYFKSLNLYSNSIGFNLRLTDDDFNKHNFSITYTFISKSLNIEYKYQFD